MKYLFVFFLLILIPASAYGFSQQSGFPEFELEPGESATYEWELNSQLNEPVTIFLYATEEGTDLLSFDKRVLLSERKYIPIPITVTIPEGYPPGYYEPWMHALMKGDSDSGPIIINLEMIKYIKITVIPPQSEYKLDLQVGKGDTIRNVLGDLTFINGTLTEIITTIYNENSELSFNGTATTNTNSEDEMLQNGINILVDPTTDGIVHQRLFELNFIPTSNGTVFNVNGTIYTIDLIENEFDKSYKSVPVQSGTLTFID